MKRRIWIKRCASISFYIFFTVKISLPSIATDSITNETELYPLRNIISNEEDPELQLKKKRKKYRKKQVTVPKQR